MSNMLYLCDRQVFGFSRKKIYLFYFCDSGVWRKDVSGQNDHLSRLCTARSGNFAHLYWCACYDFRSLGDRTLGRCRRVDLEPGDRTPEPLISGDGTPVAMISLVMDTVLPRKGEIFAPFNAGAVDFITILQTPDFGCPAPLAS